MKPSTGLVLAAPLGLCSLLQKGREHPRDWLRLGDLRIRRTRATQGLENLGDPCTLGT